MNPNLHFAISLLGATCSFVLAWRTLKTGMPAGSAKMDPRRDERPVQFWLVFCFYFAVGVAATSDALTSFSR